MPADEESKGRLKGRRKGRTRDPEPAELAALADGSLPPQRRAALEREVAASPRLQALLRSQREALAAVRARDERAPQRLRAAIEPTLARPRARRRRVVAGAAVAAAAIAAIVLLALPGSEPATPTLAQAAAIATLKPAPGEIPGGEQAWGLEFPDLEHAGGWKDAGSRIDRVGSRDARTVRLVRPELHSSTAALHSSNSRRRRPRSRKRVSRSTTARQSACE